MRADDKHEVKQALKDRIEDLCAKLLPDGRRQGRLWVAHNPVTQDYKQSPELKVALTGDTGAWRCWRAGDKGDVLGLVAFCQQTDFRGAMDWAREWLGLRAMSRAARADFSAENAARRQAAADAARDAEADKRRRVAELWAGASTILAEAPTAWQARDYFAGRGCPLDAVRHLDRDTFRVIGSLEWWRGRQGRVPGPRFPTIVSAFRDPARDVTALHCTFLADGRPVKAPVAQPKLMLGFALGSTIRIASPPAGKRVPLILCEGIEDGVTLGIGVPEARVESAGSLAGMGGVVIDPNEISAVFVAADNDWKSPQAQAQLDQVLDALERYRLPLEVMRSAVGKDFNDGMTD